MTCTSCCAIRSSSTKPSARTSRSQTREIQAYFNKNHASFDKPAQVQARHILVADLKTAQKVEADLKGGANFATEAQKYSIDPGSKDKGGELGQIRHGQMVPSFDAAVFSLPVGVISAPVKSPFGYHIIQVESRTPGTTATLANTKDKIADMLRQQQEAPLIQPFLTDLQSKANIQINDPRFQAAFPTPEPTPPGGAPAGAAPNGAAPNGAVSPAATATRLAGKEGPQMGPFTISRIRLPGCSFVSLDLGQATRDT